MNGQLFQNRTITVNRAVLRNSLLKKAPVDSSWKTVPTERKPKSTKLLKDSTNGKEAAVRRTWDNWAGPVK